MLFSFVSTLTDTIATCNPNPFCISVVLGGYVSPPLKKKYTTKELLFKPMVYFQNFTNEYAYLSIK